MVTGNQAADKESDCSDSDDGSGPKRTRSLTTTPEVTPDFVNDRRQKKKLKQRQKAMPIQNVASALEELDKIERRLSVSNIG